MGQLLADVKRLQDDANDLYSTRHHASETDEIEIAKAKLDAMESITHFLSDAHKAYTRLGDKMEKLLIVLGKPCVKDIEAIEDETSVIEHFRFARLGQGYRHQQLYVRLHRYAVMPNGDEGPSAACDRLGSPFVLSPSEDLFTGVPLGPGQSDDSASCADHLRYKAWTVARLAQSMPLLLETAWIASLRAEGIQGVLKRNEDNNREGEEKADEKEEKTREELYLLDVQPGSHRSTPHRPFMRLALAILELAGLGHDIALLVWDDDDGSYSVIKQDAIEAAEFLSQSNGAFASALRCCFDLDRSGRNNLRRLQDLQAYILRIENRLSQHAETRQKRLEERNKQRNKKRKHDALSHEQSLEDKRNRLTSCIRDERSR